MALRLLVIPKSIISESMCKLRLAGGAAHLATEVERRRAVG